MFLSIVVVCWNAGAKLKMTVDSILSQTCRDYEVVVEDSESGDGSVEALPRDPRIRVFREKDKGIYDGMNRAVKRCRGEFIYFLNCGDTFFAENTLELVKRAVEESGYDGSRPLIAYGDIYERLTGQVAQANPVMDDFACFRNVPNHQACFYSSDLLGERAFDLKYRVRADYEHFLFCKYTAGTGFLYLGFPTADYEGGGFSESAENREIADREHREITGKYLPGGKLFLYRAYLVLTLQPLRFKLANDARTAAFYDRVKSAVYRRRTKQDS